MTNIEKLHESSPTVWLFVGLLFDCICFVQIVGLIWHHYNIPDDPFGTFLYLLTIVVSGIAALFFYKKWKRGRG